jgi:hypothetical protein
MRNISDKICKDNQNAYFISRIFFFFFFENGAVYEIMWRKYVTARQSTDDNMVWRMRFAYRTNKAMNTHSEYVILVAFPL